MTFVEIKYVETKSVGMGFCSKGLKNEFETAVVNEPSVFEPLNFYCIFVMQLVRHKIDLFMPVFGLSC